MGHTGFPVELSFPVRWGEMDAFEHVNNVTYFRYFEDARIRYFRSVGMLEHMEETGCGPILASTQCRFRLPLSYPDDVTVGTCVRDLGANRFTMHYRVYSHNHKTLAASGTGLIIFYDYGAKAKADISSQIAKTISDLESGLASGPLDEG